MRNTIANPGDLSDLLVRISNLTPDDRPAWGRMSVGQMICHLTDSFLYPLHERGTASPMPPSIPIRVYKWIALNTPTRWPQGVAAPPEVEQGVGGTPPTHFSPDRDALLTALTRLAAYSGSDWPPHPIFQHLTTTEWHRWAWLHADHHLRQFGR